MHGMILTEASVTGQRSERGGERERGGRKEHTGEGGYRHATKALHNE